MTPMAPLPGSVPPTMNSTSGTSPPSNCSLSTVVMLVSTSPVAPCTRMLGSGLA